MKQYRVFQTHHDQCILLLDHSIWCASYHALAGCGWCLRELALNTRAATANAVACVAPDNASIR